MLSSFYLFRLDVTHRVLKHLLQYYCYQWVGNFSLDARFLQVFRQLARESAENMHFIFILYYLFVYFQRGFSRRDFKLLSATFFNVHISRIVVF